GLAVAPDPGGHDGLMAGVDGVVADGLADQVVGDRPALQVVLGQQLVPAGQVSVLVQRAVDLEVVAPAGELEAVVAPLPRVLADLLQRQVSPLAGEQSEGSGHGRLPRDRQRSRSGHVWSGHVWSRQVTGTGVQQESRAALRSTASRTRWTCSPSRNDG